MIQALTFLSPIVGGRLPFKKVMNHHHKKVTSRITWYTLPKLTAHPGKVSERKFIFQPSIFRGKHVSFREKTSTQFRKGLYYLLQGFPFKGGIIILHFEGVGIDPMTARHPGIPDVGRITSWRTKRNRGMKKINRGVVTFQLAHLDMYIYVYTCVYIYIDLCMYTCVYNMKKYFYVYKYKCGSLKLNGRRFLM